MRRLFTLLILISSSSLLAQNNSTIGFQIHGFLPTGELKRDAPDIWGAGFGFEAAFQVNESPIYFGGIFDFTRYGSEVRKGFFNAALPDVRYRHHNEMTRLLSLVRIKPETNTRFLPYADFQFGVGFIYTRARVFDRDFGEVIDRFFEVNDFAFTYGLGGGLEYLLEEHVSIDFHVKANFSGRAEYLTPQTIRYDPDIEGYDLNIQQSRFNAITFGFGLKFLIRETW